MCKFILGGHFKREVGEIRRERVALRIRPYANVKEGRRKLVDRVIEAFPQREVGESKREILNWLVEIGTKGEVSE